MTCDICDATIVDNPACLLGTKEVVTSKECWVLYLNGLIADHVFTGLEIPEALQGLVGQMACSDTPWALCENCMNSLKRAGFPFRPDSSELPPHGHALCRSAKPMEFTVLDDEGVAMAMKAAIVAANEVVHGHSK